MGIPLHATRTILTCFLLGSLCSTLVLFPAHAEEGLTAKAVANLNETHDLLDKLGNQITTIKTEGRSDLDIAREIYARSGGRRRTQFISEERYRRNLGRVLDPATATSIETALTAEYHSLDQSLRALESPDVGQLATHREELHRKVGESAFKIASLESSWEYLTFRLRRIKVFGELQVKRSEKSNSFMKQVMAELYPNAPKKVRALLIRSNSSTVFDIVHEVIAKPRLSRSKTAKTLRPLGLDSPTESLGE